MTGYVGQGNWEKRGWERGVRIKDTLKRTNARAGPLGGKWRREIDVREKNNALLSANTIPES